MPENISRITIGYDQYLTPPNIIHSLGQFDLDPAAPPENERPWPMAKNHFTKFDDGLSKDWYGRVWLNPPYGEMTSKFIQKLSLHGNGIALTFARVDTIWFFDYVWNRADAIFFLKGRIKFVNPQGIPYPPAGAASCLIAYGQNNVQALEKCGLIGKLIYLKGANNGIK